MREPLTIRTVIFVLFAGATGISTGSRSKPYARWCARCRTTWTTISAHCIQRQGARRSRKTVAEHAAAAVVRCAERTATDGWPSPDDVGWDATTCTKHLERLQQGDLFNHFMGALLQHEDITTLLSDKHFSGNSTLVEALAGHKIFKPNDDTDSDGEHFHGTTPKNDTRASTTNPDSCLSRKSDGKEWTLRDMRHATMENRNALAVKGTVTNGRRPKKCWPRTRRRLSPSLQAWTRPTTSKNTSSACT